MPTPMDAMLGLVVTAIGLMTLVIAFGLTDAQKKMISYAISGIVIVAGLFYYVSSELRGFQMRRRISNIQRQQQVNLEDIRKRLQDGQAQQGKAPAAPVTQKP